MSAEDLKKTNSREQLREIDTKLSKATEEVRVLEEARTKFLNNAYEEAFLLDLEHTYPEPENIKSHSREGYQNALDYLEKIDQRILTQGVSDEELLFLTRRRIELGAVLDHLDQEAPKEAEKEELLREVRMKLSGERLKDLGVIGDLFRRRFEKGFGEGKSETYKTTLPGFSKITIEYWGDRIHVLLGGERLIVYKSGKIEGKLPKEFTFGKTELLEELVSILDTVNDAFYQESESQEILLDNTSDFTVEGEVVPPGDTEEREWKGGESTGSKPPPDPRRLEFYKSLPGVLATFDGEVNTRQKIEKYGVEGIPYQGYIFLDYIVLDCHEVGNAIFVRKLDQPIDVPIDRLQLPASERMTADEKARFKNEIWTRFRDSNKNTLKEMGFVKMNHPPTDENDPEFYKKYFNRLARQIEFSKYGDVPAQYASD